MTYNYVGSPRGGSVRWELLCEDVGSELSDAQSNFSPFYSAHEGWAFIKEELDELWEIVRQKQSTPNRQELMRKEAIQVAAMALRFLDEMDEFQN